MPIPRRKKLPLETSSWAFSLSKADFPNRRRILPKGCMTGESKDVVMEYKDNLFFFRHNKEINSQIGGCDIFFLCIFVFGLR